ncbi:Dps family protein [Fretibacter rubidus]|uniref:Dps family protein n=1 Tax=Fretibacter rubidus TaxID=570162 RepID=UPI00352A38D5
MANAAVAHSRDNDKSSNDKDDIRALNRPEIAKRLGIVLADSYQLFIKTQGVHWNVTGPLFYSIHNLTEEHYTNLFAAVDELAERIRSLGEKAPASYTKYGELSAVEDVDEPKTAEDMIAMLAKDHNTVCSSLRAAIGFCEGKDDFVTADMLTERLAWHEEAIWMLSSIIEK